MVEVESSRALKEVEGEEMEVVLPFEVAAGDSQSLLSLTKEMEHLLDPLVWHTVCYFSLCLLFLLHVCTCVFIFYVLCMYAVRGTCTYL